MKYLTASALTVLLVGSMSIGGLVPARADDAATTPPPAPTQATDHPGNPAPPDAMGPRRMGRDGGPGAGLLTFACGDRGAEALEIALVRVKYRVKPTAEQLPLFTALETAALAGQQTFADACATARSAGNASIVDRLQNQLSLATARAAALNEVVPKLKAFYNSLTPEQQATLEQRGAWRMSHRGGGGWQHGPFRAGANSPMPYAHMHQGDGRTETNPAPPAAPGGQPNPPPSSD